MLKASKAQYLILVLVILAILILLFSTNIRQPSVTLIENSREWPHEPPLHFRPLQSDYQKKLFNLTLNYTLYPSSCTNNYLAIIIVTSYFGNVETRSAMRRAYSTQDLENLQLKRIFLLGEAPNDFYTKQGSVAAENRRFSDILQGNFLEAYRNLTYKHIMGLKWASENCIKTKFIIKMDDDTVVDIIKLKQLIKTSNFPENLIGGYILRGLVPIREPANKWFVSHEEFNQTVYPPFVSGWLYITTPKIAGKLVLLSNYIDYFWIDDAYITGMLAKNLKIRQYDLSEAFAVHSEYLECCLDDYKSHMDCDYFIGPNGGDPNLFYEFNEQAKICRQFRCEKRKKALNETCVAKGKVNLGRGNGMIEGYKLT